MVRAFIAFQLLAPLAVAILCPHDRYGDAVLKGILGAQATLVGAWIALGASRVAKGLSGAVLTIVWFTIVLAQWRKFNGWIVVLLGFQVVVTAGVLHYSQRSSRSVLTTSDVEEEGLRLQFRISHMLLLMVAIPLLWGVVPMLSRLPFLAHLSIGLYVYVFATAVGCAIPPLIACWAIFGRAALRWRVPAATIAILLAATAAAYVGYSQIMIMRMLPNARLLAGITWFLWSIVQATFAAVSFYWLKRLGFRVGRLLKVSAR